MQFQFYVVVPELLWQSQNCGGCRGVSYCTDKKSQWLDLLLRLISWTIFHKNQTTVQLDSFLEPCIWKSIALASTLNDVVSITSEQRQIIVNKSSAPQSKACHGLVLQQLYGFMTFGGRVPNLTLSMQCVRLTPKINFKNIF